MAKGFELGLLRWIGEEARLVWAGVVWWKRKVIQKRPIAQDDAKAWRMIRRWVKDHLTMGLAASAHDDSQPTSESREDLA